MSGETKVHLEGRWKDHATLCNVKTRRWQGKVLIKVVVKVVSEHAFAKLPLAEQCQRCFLALCAREGIPVVRQR